MKLDIYSNEKKIGVCAYVECVRPATAVRRLKKAVETSKKMDNKEKALVLEWLEDEEIFMETLNGATHSDAGKDGFYAWAIELESVDEGYWYISVSVKKEAGIKEAEEAWEKEEATKKEAEKEEVSNDKEAPSTQLEIESSTHSIKVRSYIDCEDNITAVRSFKKAIKTSNKLSDEERNSLLEWIRSEKEFLEILDGYEHAYEVNHKWAIDLIEVNKGRWFISLYARKIIKQ